MRGTPTWSCFICSSVITWASHAPVRTIGYARCFTVDGKEEMHTAPLLNTFIPVPRTNQKRLYQSSSGDTEHPVQCKTSIQRRPAARTRVQSRRPMLLPSIENRAYKRLYARCFCSRQRPQGTYIPMEESQNRRTSQIRVPLSEMPGQCLYRAQ